MTEPTYCNPYCNIRVIQSVDTKFEFNEYVKMFQAEAREGEAVPYPETFDDALIIQFRQIAIVFPFIKRSKGIGDKNGIQRPKA